MLLIMTVNIFQTLIPHQNHKNNIKTVFDNSASSQKKFTASKVQFIIIYTFYMVDHIENILFCL